jgi:hypothetical protein
MSFWRSFPGIWRKRNARTVRPGGEALLAFDYRDMAEIERQNQDGRLRRRRPLRYCRRCALVSGRRNSCGIRAPEGSL